MDEKLKEQLKIKAISEMKSPVILMNNKDFENFMEQIERAQDGSNPPTFEGIPIIEKNFICEGEFFVYDGDVWDINFNKVESYLNETIK